MKLARHIFLLAALATLGCGYHTAGHATRIPASVRTIAVPIFVNQTQTYRIEQMLTRDVVREFLARTHYQIANDDGKVRRRRAERHRGLRAGRAAHL